jgi:chemotaxis protein methyltransferase CheR
MDDRQESDALEDLEISLLLEGVYQRYGYDFRQYAYPSLRRRIRNVLRAEQLSSISCLQDRVLRDTAALERLVLGITVAVTAMFRDPDFYRQLREKVVPMLRTYPFVRIWHAGCSTGEEAYSMAILLEEEGLYDRCRIYATDMNRLAVKRARDGIFSLAFMKEYTDNYLKAGGRACFSDYYSADSQNVILRQSLRRNMVFAEHNLVSDGSFNEFNFILCRNVMIYFQKPLQEKVFSLLHESLRRFGVIALGSKESVKLSPYESCYEELAGCQRLYKKVG